MVTELKSFFYWLKLLSKFVSFQLVVQVLNLSSGLLIVRILSKQEYAYFTLANAMQTTINMLADSGISSALSSIGGKVWQDPYRFGQLINTALQWRKYLAIVSITIVTPILFLMLFQSGASISYTILLIIGILIEINFYLSAGVIGIVIRLHSQIGRIQSLDLLSAGSRIILLLGATTLTLNAALGVFASTIASGLHNLVLWHWVKNTINIKAPLNKDDQSEIFKIVKSQAPNTIFYCIQGQLTVFLISIFGNTDNIAEIGALGRIGAIFSVINAVMNNIILPSFARCQSVKILYSKYWQILGSLSLLALLMFSLVSIFPNEMLWVLGGKYTHLHRELLLITASSLFNFIVAAMWSMNASRGWIHYSWLYIPSTLTTQVFLIMILDLTNIQGVLLFNAISAIPSFLLNIFLSYRGFMKMVQL